MNEQLLNYHDIVKAKKTCGDCKYYDNCYAKSCEYLGDYTFSDYEDTKNIPACSEFINE